MGEIRQENLQHSTIYTFCSGSTIMAAFPDQDHSQLVARLTTGFGAMLEQVQELAGKNTELEQRLASVREEVPSSPLSSFCLPCYDVTQ